MVTYSNLALCGGLPFTLLWTTQPLFLGNGVDLLSGTNTVLFCFSPQLETVFSVNVLQFIFLSLKLDRVIYWSWVVSTQSCAVDEHLTLKQSTRLASCIAYFQLYQPYSSQLYFSCQDYLSHACQVVCFLLHDKKNPSVMPGQVYPHKRH